MFAPVFFIILTVMTWEYRCIGIKIQVKGTDYGYHMRVNLEGSHGKESHFEHNQLFDLNQECLEVTQNQVKQTKKDSKNNPRYKGFLNKPRHFTVSSLLGSLLLLSLPEPMLPATHLHLSMGLGVACKKKIIFNQIKYNFQKPHFSLVG